MTDVQDVKNCKIIRKLAVHETFKCLEGPSCSEGSKVERARAYVYQDKSTGWITIKGNAGTVYAEEKTKFQSLLHPTTLQRSFGVASAETTVRALEKGEDLEIVEG